MRYVVAFALIMSVSPALAQQHTNVYGADGSWQGYVSSDGHGHDSYYGNAGQWQGYSNTQNGSTSYYGQSGQYLGHSTDR